MKPIFLHGLWRCSSTYLWSRFRVLDNCYCFYEPMTHRLDMLTKDRVDRDINPEHFKDFRHPAEAEQYYREFVPLIKPTGRGVKNYNASLMWDRFALEPNEEHKPLKHYITMLIDHAKSVNKIPVMGFNRTNFRFGWIKNNFDAYNIFIERDPFDIAMSYWTRNIKDDPTFFVIWLYLLERNANNPLFKPLAEAMPIRRGLARYLSKRKTYYKKIIKGEFNQGMSYFLALYLWRASILNALIYSDVIVDISRMDEEGYKQYLSDKILSATGLEVSFEDARTARYKGEYDCDRKKIEQAVMDIFPHHLFDAGKARARLDEICQEKRDLLSI